METIEIVDFTGFKRGMVGLLKMLMAESLESQRLDHYSMYKTMLDITDRWKSPAGGDNGLDELINEDEEAIARMILNFPKDN